MCKVFFGFLFFSLFFRGPVLPAMAGELPAAGLYTYIERTGNREIEFYWKAVVENDQVLVHVFEEGKSFFNICKSDGATLKWKIKNRDRHDISVVRKGDSLYISGIRNGRPYEKTVAIDSRPWYQPLSFSLGNFLDSSRIKTTFWTIRADTIEAIALQAVKMGEETITVRNRPMTTWKIEVRPAGILSPFWHGSYWFRKEDNLFLRYRSVHGLPGTEETVVELKREPD